MVLLSVMLAKMWYWSCLNGLNNNFWTMRPVLGIHVQASVVNIFPPIVNFNTAAPNSLLCISCHLSLSVTQRHIFIFILKGFSCPVRALTMEIWLMGLQKCSNRCRRGSDNYIWQICGLQYLGIRRKGRRYFTSFFSWLRIPSQVFCVPVV